MKEKFMKKLSFVLLSIFAIHADLFGSEKQQTKKKTVGNIVIKVAKPLIIALHAFQAGVQYNNYATKECGIDTYPNAKLWFGAMTEKYPVADLKSAEFCQGNQWLNSGNRIFANPGDLQVIDHVYDKKMKNMTLSEAEKNDLNLEEFLLLHEAAHRKNRDTSVSSIATDLIKQTIVAQGLNFYAENGAHTGIAIATAYGLNSALGIDHSLKIETRADKFACDHAADSDVLQGGLGFFNRVTALGAQGQDSLHPHSQLRAQKVVDEIHRRWILENTCPAQK
jgi:Peptidase family M48